MNVNMADLIKLIVSILVCQFVGFLGSLVTKPAIPTWYTELSKPAYRPPDWVFGPVWITLYLLMGISVFLIWRMGFSSSQVRLALSAFLIQLILNGLWSFLFFGLKSPFLGLVDLILLWIFIMITMITFAKLSQLAAFLLVPYIAWVTFALLLNFSIWQMNPKG